MGHRISQQHLFAVIHEREFRATTRSLRQWCSIGEDGRVIRATMRSLIQQEQLLRDVIRGWNASPAVISETSRANELLADYEHAHAEARESLSRLTPEQWEVMIDCPHDVAFWPSVRRGELLWMALRDLVDQAERFVSNSMVTDLPTLSTLREA